MEDFEETDQLQMQMERHLRRHSSPRVDTCSGIHPPRTKEVGREWKTSFQGIQQDMISCVDDNKSSFRVFLPESIEGIILEMTNSKGEVRFWRHLERNRPGRPGTPQEYIA